MSNPREVTASWFESLRDDICQRVEEVESIFAQEHNLEPAQFEKKSWNRDGGGGGVMSILHGNVFEKMGVNISTVHGEFTEEVQKNIPGAKDNPEFFATGISLVMHPKNPLVPAMHFNTRYIETQKTWFGGGGDMTPTFEEKEETELFHKYFKDACDKHDPEYYPKYKKWCDEYFFLPHRGEPRGVGGIFYDYHNSDNFDEDFEFTKDVGRAMADVIPDIVKRKMNLDYTAEQKHAQLVKRGRYVEFNLLYDRGTKFGLMTGGNTEAILMSLPPEVVW